MRVAAAAARCGLGAALAELVEAGGGAAFVCGDRAAARAVQDAPPPFPVLTGQASSLHPY
jgi:hypothetical protein